MPTAEQTVGAAGLSLSAYCRMTPEARAELRQRANLPHLIDCEGDPPRDPG